MVLRSAMMSEQRLTWQLSPRADRRFQAGHPWVFSNELTIPAHDLKRGQATWVELQDPKGTFVAFGLGNPHSLISFRTLYRGRIGKGQESIDAELSLSLSQALREGLDLVSESFRLIHGEADGFPGLIVDWYVLNSESHIVANMSLQSAGAELLVPVVKAWLMKQAREMGLEIAIGEMRDSISRVYEGLKQETETVFSFSEGFKLKPESLQQATILVNGLQFECNLVSGQKTGFFLDQRSNARALATDFAAFAKSRKMVRVLDLCTYVGQWSSAWVRQWGSQTANVTLVDASARARIKS